MTESQSYIIDVLNLVPDNSVCYIQAPSIENMEFINLMKESPFEYFKQLALNPENKKILIRLIETENVEDFFHNIEIRYNNQLLFEGYDGMEFGTVSKTLQLPGSFKEKYIRGLMCVVSNEW
ncbi:MAG: hypothetical protein SFU87_00500 [Chitinophagaceae bacterium]|nr:hypothetical protein [Chitinophagaceae bacterium]